MTNVIHDPRTDWCACQPGAAVRCDYRLLADGIESSLAVRDGDESEVSLCIDAVERVAAYVRTLPCTCAPGYDKEPCERCAALGQWHGEAWN